MRKQFYPVLRGEGGTKFSHFVAPLPVINDQSLILSYHTRLCIDRCLSLSDGLGPD